MSILNKIIEDYESATVDNYFKPKSRPKCYGFRILDKESMINGWEVFVEETDESGNTIKRPKRFLPENRKMAQSWATDKNPAKPFLAMKIWLIDDKECYLYSMTQASVIKAIFDIAKEVGVDNLEKVIFFLTKQGEGKETKYSLSASKDDETLEIKLTPTPKEALDALAARPINILAVMFGDRPWDNDIEYDVRDLVQRPKPCPIEIAKAMESIPSSARSKKAGVARV